MAVLQAAQIREQQQEADRAKATVHRTAAASVAPLADGSFQLVVPFPRKVRYGTVRSATVGSSCRALPVPPGEYSYGHTCLPCVSF